MKHKRLPVSPGAVKTFRRFHARSPEKITSINLPSFPKEIVYLGDALSIAYRAKNKMNSPKPNGGHEHKFGKGVKIYADPTGKCLYVLGGKFRVTDWLRG